MRRRQSVTSAGVLAMTIAASLLASPLRAEETAAPASAGDATELAKKTQNPVADLISVPFQNNLSFGLGPKDATQWVMNVQPVIPIELTDDWNLITRTRLWARRRRARSRTQDRTASSSPRACDRRSSPET